MSSRRHRARHYLRRGWMPAVATVLALLLFTPLLAPTSGAPGGDDEASLSSAAATARDLGLAVHTAAITPVSIGPWDPDRTVLVVHDPTLTYSPAEAERIAQWVRDGGRLLLADGGGAARPLVQALGASVGTGHVFDATLTNPDATVVNATLALPDTGPITLALRTPFPMAQAQEAPVLARTGDQSFVDLNGNDRLDPSDTRGPFIVGVSVAQGRAILLSGGGFLDDQGLERAQNAQALEALLAALLPEGGHVVFEVGHAAHNPAGASLLSAAQAPLAVLEGLPWGLAAALLVAGAVVAVLLPATSHAQAWTRYDHDPEALQRPHVRLDAATVRRHVGDPGAARARDRLADRRQALSDALDDLTIQDDGSPPS